MDVMNEDKVNLLRDVVMDYVSENMEGEADLTKFGCSLEELLSKALSSHQSEFNSLSESDKRELVVDSAWLVEDFIPVALLTENGEEPKLDIANRFRAMLKESGFDAIDKAANAIREDILLYVYGGVDDGSNVTSLYEKLIKEHSKALNKDTYPCFDYRLRYNSSLFLARTLRGKYASDKLTNERIKEAENLRFTNA